MATPKGKEPDTFPDLQENLKNLSNDSARWLDEVKPPGTTPEEKEADREKALIRINELLGVIKSEINVYWGPAIDPDHEVRLLIADKHINPYHKQVEDIEGDVHRIEGI
jgi:hypothetical protein